MISFWCFDVFLVALLFSNSLFVWSYCSRLFALPYCRVVRLFLNALKVFRLLPVERLKHPSSLKISTDEKFLVCYEARKPRDVIAGLLILQTGGACGTLWPSPFISKHVKRLIHNTKSTERNTSLRCRHYRTRWCLRTKVDPLALPARRQWARGTHYFQYVYV